MSEFTVPLDIVQNIVDILVDDEEGLEYVKAVSLTCQSFLPFCRKHLFSSISITMDGIRPSVKPTPEAFEHFLLETPAIAKYIRQLTICIVQRPSFDSEYSFDQVAQQLTGLQSLTLSLLNRYQATSTDWNNISSSTRLSLLNLMHLPTLSRLVLQTVKNFPISNLITCTNLKHLCAKDFYVDGSERGEAGPSLLHKSMQLQSLDLEINGSQTLTFLTARCPNGRPAVDFTGLKKLSIELYTDCRGTAIPIREICRQTQGLTDINLQGDDVDFQPLKLATMVTPSLQTLRRLGLEIFNESHSMDPLAVICDELEQISSKNVLEYIDIKVILDTDEDCRKGDEWGRLEEILLRWPMLKHISLVIVFNTFHGLRIDGPFGLALKSLPRTQFTRLMSSNNLDFKFSVEEILI